MHPVAEDSTLWNPQTEEEKEMVREQMNRLLETSHFKNSRRYPALFRFIVEETLDGRGEFLKERLLGIRVFERPADYDTAADPIVRVTIAEIRKRIAQYYHEEAHETEMRIELLPGRYEPEFRPRKEITLDRSQAAVGSQLQEQITSPPGTTASLDSAPPTQKSQTSGWKKLVFGTIAALLLAATVAFSWRWTHPSAIEEFWQPILATHQTIVFCLPNGAGRTAGSANSTQGQIRKSGAELPSIGKDAAKPTFLEHESLGENVVFSDALATIRISNFVAAQNRKSRFRLNVDTSLDDLRQGPAVLIGGLDNQWTMRAIAPLRFHFAGSDEESYWVTDDKNPQKKDWALDLKIQYAVVNRDYAIIARVHDEATGELEVIVAGIGMSGTAAAGEFLVDPQQLEELRRRVGPGFRDRDFEAVLSTDVVNGIAGSPRILTVAVW
jgi:hypothetical protein